MQINIDRLINDINKYADYGQDPSGGLTRPSFSKPDYEVRKMFTNDLEEIGLSVTIDPIANIWGLYDGEDLYKKSITIGSHLDTVPNGGRFDGALGVLVAKEILQTIIENKIKLKHPIEIVSLTAEEPNDFNLSTMGSRTLVGKLKKEELEKVTDSGGMYLKDAVKKAGGSLQHLPIKKDTIAAFLELHIEQGKRLETDNLSVGVVDKIVGIYRDKVIVYGEANHSGTTMMKDRKDALVTASKMVAAVDEIVNRNGTEAVATIGKLDVSPNAANIVPGSVEMILEIRSGSEKERWNLRDRIYEEWNSIVNDRQISMNVENILDQKECNFDPNVVKWIKEAAAEIDVPNRTLSSMAGHDSTHLAGIAKTAMIFVKSVNGKSHSSDEYSRSEDIEKAANVMLHAVLKIDDKLD